MKRLGFLVSFFLFFANSANAQVCEIYLKKIGHENYKSSKQDITEIAYSSSINPSSYEFEECRKPRYEYWPKMKNLWYQGMDFFCNEVLVGRTVFNIKQRTGGGYVPSEGVLANYIFDSLGTQWQVGHIAKRNQKESQSCIKISDNLYIRESEKLVLKMWIPAAKKYHVRKIYSVWRYFVF